MSRAFSCAPRIGADDRSRAVGTVPGRVNLPRPLAWRRPLSVNSGLAGMRRVSRCGEPT
ncbi:hypothetical protein [Lysobacter gummosus]|uniref:hypothetical protein n=1 Tax=Lysobacter gummosus TaxID=262324 RepID=UPI00363B30BE